MKTFTKKALIAAVATASVAGGAQVAAAPAANAAVNFGAIAVASNGATGRAWDYASPGAAERAALGSCGYASCKVLASFSDGCGAVAQKPGWFQGGTGRSIRAAQSSALTRNGGGAILVWQCTSGHL
ncbi:DUF4189 domain-containing protein [Tsukamurella asaccharolytica]|uniref:DUF4189 domain-containing protein n=1 Tax=Tsukamurella asaccharolytica TaxID=2592067 RepID=A0A5C5R7S4_9ACTN|nr:DUF4189 domain-containing protein [Tsukamurella asaccharolytica]TWS18878.1 DUF4189 domain-containing protein [Tsukamurella asaccharolytica]